MSLIPDLTIADAVDAHPLRHLKRNTSTMTTCEIGALPLQSAARVHPDGSWMTRSQPILNDTSRVKPLRFALVCRLVLFFETMKSVSCGDVTKST